jgi:hypothetical protein
MTSTSKQSTLSALHKILDDLAKDKGIEIGPYWYQEINVQLALASPTPELTGADEIVEACAKIASPWSIMAGIEIRALKGKFTGNQMIPTQYELPVHDFLTGKTTTREEYTLRRLIVNWRLNDQASDNPLIGGAFRGCANELESVLDKRGNPARDLTI